MRSFVASLVSPAGLASVEGRLLGAGALVLAVATAAALAGQGG